MNKKHKSSIALPQMSRRTFVTGMAAGAALLGATGSRALSSDHRPATSPQTLRGNNFDLNIGYTSVNFTGRSRTATTVNGSLPAPVLRWREGQRVTLNVNNSLAHDSSIHWHGIILPTGQDGVPGLSFNGIRPGETFQYQFDLNQSGTYWYHSHSGFQEQTGVYGAIVIDPAGPDPVEYDRDYVVLLSDWSDTAPDAVYGKLKNESHYYNFRRRTVGDLWSDIREKGVRRTFREREMWNEMRMSDTDISDVTGYTYTYLMNGQTPDANWTALFKRGEKVRLRFINAAAMSIFDVRIPGLKMKVVATDGQNIEPVSVDEFRIGVAETYDVVVEPEADTAYTLFAQTIDRSGFARGTLTPELGLSAAVPAMDYAPVLGHRDMGMAHDMGEWTTAAWVVWTTRRWITASTRWAAWTIPSTEAWTTRKWTTASTRWGYGSLPARRHGPLENGPQPAPDERHGSFPARRHGPGRLGSVQPARRAPGTGRHAGRLVHRETGPRRLRQQQSDSAPAERVPLHGGHARGAADERPARSRHWPARPYAALRPPGAELR
ncbi:copper resistance system multicopper oxidase [Microbulbifer taiwanensis]|uniref:copper resistance system multicopper oxidase n=1 Tax=Microbulbifer taiwanensis TaxID=986746 RepID=UPI00361DFDDD